jgi:hypothetical protein
MSTMRSNNLKLLSVRKLHAEPVAHDEPPFGFANVNTRDRPFFECARGSALQIFIPVSLALCCKVTQSRMKSVKTTNQ